MSYSEIRQVNDNGGFINLFLEAARSQKNPEKVKKTLIDALVDETFREVFMNFAETHPVLFSASPILHRTLDNANALKASEQTEKTSLLPYFASFTPTVSKIYEWATDTYPKQLEKFEHIIFKKPNKLLQYLGSNDSENRVLFVKKLKLLYAYIQAGVIDPKNMVPKLVDILSVEDMYGNPAIKLNEVFKATLPILRDLVTRNEDDFLIDILSIQIQDDLLGKGGLIRLSVPFLQGLVDDGKDDLLVRILSITNKDGYSLLNHWAYFNSYLPLLESLSDSGKDDLVVRILSIQNLSGLTVFQYKRVFQYTLYFLKYLENRGKDDLIVRILSIRNRDGFIPLACTTLFEISLSFLMYLETKGRDELIVRILSIRDKDGTNVFQIGETCKTVFVYLMDLTSRGKNELVISILSILNKDGETALTNKELFHISLPWLKDLAITDKDLLIRILSIQVSIGTTLVYYVEAFECLLPWLEELGASDTELLVRILSLRNSIDGNTPLHHFDIFHIATKLITASGIDLKSLENARGLAPGQHFFLSNSWLTKPKYDPELMVQLSLEEYKIRAAQLKDEVLDAWDLLLFGYAKEEPNPNMSNKESLPKAPVKELNPILLDVKSTYKSVTDARIKLTESQIADLNLIVRSALKKMLERIESQEAFLGTPREDQPVERHNFYKSMLIRFEQVLRANKKRGDSYVAGSMISIATTEIKRRCAAGYMSEIVQQADLCRYDEGNITLEELVNRSAATSFQALLEKLVGTHYNGDSHYLNQFFYAAELSPVPDPLSNMQIDLAQRIILENIEFVSFAKEFSKAMPSVYVTRYLYSMTPESYDEGYLTIIAQAKKEEEAVIEQTKEILNEDLSKEALDKAFKIVQSYRGSSLVHTVDSLLFKGPKSLVVSANEQLAESFNEPLRKVNLKEIDLPILPESPSEEDIAQVKEKLKMHLVEQFRLPEGATDKQKIAYANVRRITYNEVIRYIDTLNSVVKLRAEMLSKEIYTANECLAIIMAQDHYRAGMTKIARKIEEQVEGTSIDASFNPKEGRMPSQVYEEKRCIAYNQQWIGSMLHSSVKVLESIGALEKDEVSFAKRL